MGMNTSNSALGLCAVTLGHGYKPAAQAAYEAMKNGTNFTRPAKLEIEAAETFLRCLPNADMVKFAKHGSDATTAAVKIAGPHGSGTDCGLRLSSFLQRR